MNTDTFFPETHRQGTKMNLVNSNSLILRSVLFRKTDIFCMFIAALLGTSTVHAATRISGTVLDLNGNPLPQVQVIYARGSTAIGANVVTVFTDSAGKFAYPDPFIENIADLTDIGVRALGYEQLDQVAHNGSSTQDTLVNLTFVMQKINNQIAVAPASAWLVRIENRAEQSKFVMDCIDCHQVPASEQRAYAASIADLHAADPALARTQSWNAIVKYMNYLSAWEFSRGRRSPDEILVPDAVYAVDNGEEVAAKIAEIFTDRLDHISGYSWGAPLITTG